MKTIPSTLVAVLLPMLGACPTAPAPGGSDAGARPAVSTRSLDFLPPATARSITVWNSGVGGSQLVWNASPSVPWLAVTPNTGTSRSVFEGGEVDVTFNPDYYPGVALMGKVHFTAQGLSAVSTAVTVTANSDGTHFAGRNVTGVTAADFDGDGIMDAAWVDRSGNALLVQASSAQQGKGAPVVDTYPVGVAPQSVVVYDMDLDGRLDLVVACKETNEAVLRLGVGDGTFPYETRAALPAYPVAVAAGQFTLDSVPDLISVHGVTAGRVTVLEAGSPLAYQRDEIALRDAVNSAVAVDFDGDGFVDVAAALAAETNNIEIRFDAAGSSAQVNLAVAGTPRAIGAADMNADGLLDFTVSSGGSVTPFYNDGGRRFTAGAEVELGEALSAIAFADLNEDGFLDVIAADEAAGALRTALGNGDQTFTADSSAAVVMNPDALHATDFNGDGHVDVIAVALDVGAATVRFGDGTGALTE